MASAAAESKIYAGTHSDFFLKLGDVKGESQDDKHKGEIDVFSFSFGANQPGSSAIGGQGAGVGKVNFSEFGITKQIDASTPKLMLGCATGQHFPEATFTARRAGGTQSEYLKIKLTNVLISSYRTTSHGEGGATDSGLKATLPIDVISLNFAKIEFNYKAQNPDGTDGANTQAIYNLQTNKKE
jgi:type VI secretion system secreted protein Hcp